MARRLDGTQEYAARRRGEDFDRMRFATLETLTLSPLPCWKHLPEEKQRRLVAVLIAEIEAEAEVRRQHTGSQVLGVSAVRGKHPFDRPQKSKKSPAPLQTRTWTCLCSTAKLKNQTELSTRRQRDPSPR